MCIDMPIDMGMDECIDVSTDMHIDMCMDMCDDQVLGDGREMVVADESAFKVRSEDGRPVCRV